MLSPSLRNLFLILDCLAQLFNTREGHYHNLICHASLNPKGVLPLSEQKQKKSRLRGEAGGEKWMGEEEGEETVFGM